MKIYSDEICKYCGKPLANHGIQKAFVVGYEDYMQIHCINEDCPLKYATGRSAIQIFDTWETDLRNRGFIK